MLFRGLQGEVLWSQRDIGGGQKILLLGTEILNLELPVDHLFQQGGGSYLVRYKWMVGHSFVIWSGVFSWRVRSEESPTEDCADADWSHWAACFAIFERMEEVRIVSFYQNGFLQGRGESGTRKLRR